LVNFKRNIDKRGSTKSHYTFTEPIPDYIQGVVDTCLKIHKNLPGGDILAFLTGQEEVDRAVSLLNDHASTDKGKCIRAKCLKMY
jgi:ATP-dependent RNA helicase DDX35